MTATGRALVACIALAIAGAAWIVHPAAGDAAVGVVTLVLGYALGDRNGEKRTAAAVNVLGAAESVRSVVRDVLPGVVAENGGAGVTIDAREPVPERAAEPGDGSR